MKTRDFLQTLIMAVLSQVVIARADDQGTNPRIVRQAFVGDGVFLGFAPEGRNWVSVESSRDLRIWFQAGSVASTNGTTMLLDESASGAAQQFYRLRRPGYSVEEAEAKWLPQAVLDHQFQLLHVDGRAETRVLTGTVTRRGGQKIITEAQNYGQPLEQVDPADFPSIEELLDQLKQAQKTGCRRVAVVYDETLSYPVWCVIEHFDPDTLWHHFHSYRIAISWLCPEEFVPLDSPMMLLYKE